MIDERQTDLAAEPIITGNTKAAVKAIGGGSSDLWMVDPRKLHYDSRDNVRPLIQERVEHFKRLMLANGFQKDAPLACFVRKEGDADKIYVQAGQHRYHAALAAIACGEWASKEVKFDRVPIVIRDARTVDRKTLLITGVTSNDSEKLTPLELAGVIAELQREGMTQAEICRALNITGQTVRDVMLLLDAPPELHDLIRDKAITSTLAIKTIRDVGATKALDVIEKALSVATKDGRTKVTQKNLDTPKPANKTAATTGEITPTQAKQLFRALQTVCLDPHFAQLTMRATDAVLNALAPLEDLLDDSRRAGEPEYAEFNENGVAVGGIEKLAMPKGSSSASVGICVVCLAPDQWLTGYDYFVGSGGASSGPSKHDEAHPTRERAIIARVDDIDRQIRKSNSKDHKDAKRALAWLADVRARAQVGAI